MSDLSNLLGGILGDDTAAILGLLEGLIGPSPEPEESASLQKQDAPPKFSGDSFYSPAFSDEAPPVYGPPRKHESFLENPEKNAPKTDAPEEKTPPDQGGRTSSFSAGAMPLGGSAGLGSIDPILHLVGQFSHDDKNIHLLRALQPHLTPPRAARVEEMIKILKLVNLVPLLRGFGEKDPR